MIILAVLGVLASFIRIKQGLVIKSQIVRAGLGLVFLNFAHMCLSVLAQLLIGFVATGIVALPTVRSLEIVIKY
jgi:hypothetical protein